MGERSGAEGLLAQAESAPLTGLAESLGIERATWIATATQPLPETLRLSINHYDKSWTRAQLLAMGAEPLKWSCRNEAYQLPFARGQAPRDGTRELLALLHDTGRITRQEAASMLPILVLEPKTNDLLLDLCAAPGSKATHAAELMAPEGVVVANEPISGRVNMLASNRGRLSLHNVIISQHDGRHVGRIPKPGFDAVVAELIRTCPWMELVEIDDSKVDGLLWHQGLTDWHPLDEEGNIPHDANDVPLFDPRHLPPEEKELLEALPNTRRLYPHDNDTGGFFVALLRHREQATPEGVAKTFIDKLTKRRLDSSWESRLLPAPDSNRHTIHGARQDDIDSVVEQCQLAETDYSWWQRGKRMAVAPRLVYDRIWTQETPNKRGDRWPGRTFHPLQVLHVGLPAFVSKNGSWRARQESIPLLYSQLSDDVLTVETEVLVRLLRGEALEPDVLFDEHDNRQGALLLRCHHETGTLIVNAWRGTRITLMLDNSERRLLSIRLGLEEEE